MSGIGDFHRLAGYTIAVLAAGLKAAEVCDSWRTTREVTGHHGPRYDERSFTAKSGNEISYRLTETGTDTRGGRAAYVLCHGLGATSNTLLLLAEQIHRSTGGDVILYDRAGYRRSRAGGSIPYAVSESVNDLLDLLDLLGRETPVTLVGHSLGGYVAHRAATERPDRIGAVWLIEPTHPREIVTSSEKLQGALAVDEAIRINSTLMGLGAGALKNDRGYPAAWRANPYLPIAEAELKTGRVWRAMRREWGGVLPILLDGGSQVAPPHRPTTVITSDRTLHSVEGQGHLFADFMTGEREPIVVPAADHHSIVLQPDKVHQVATIIGAHD